MSTKQMACQEEAAEPTGDREVDPHSLSALLTQGRYFAVPKYLAEPDYQQQVGPRGIQLALTLCAAYDLGRSRHPRDVVNGEFALPDQHVADIWGADSTTPVRDARSALLAAEPKFLEFCRIGRSGHPTEYKIRATTEADRVTPKKKVTAMPPRPRREFPVLAGQRYPETAVGERTTDWMGVAMGYVGRGFSIIPVTGKFPVLRSWKPYQDRQPGETELAKWHAKYPKAGIAIVTGALSNLVVIDIDGPLESGLRLLAENGIELPETTRVKSGRGHHFWFRHPGIHVKSTTKVLTNDEVAIDVRGDGGYIVAPPSVHASGVRYTFQHEVDVLPALPRNFLALLRETVVERQNPEAEAA